VDISKYYILLLVRFWTLFGICRYYNVLCRLFGINAVVLRKPGNVCTEF